MEEAVRACCFTGHRPHKLPWGYDEEHPGCGALRLRMLREITRLCYDGITTFLTGMAAGVDLIAAETVLDLKQAMPEKEIRLIAVLPYEEQAAKWSRDLRERYFRVLEQVDDTILLSGRYTPTCLAERNKYLVDHATHMIAVYRGGTGGTRNTIAMGQQKNLDITVINPDELEEDENAVH